MIEITYRVNNPKFRIWDEETKTMGNPFTFADAAYEGFPRPVTDDNGEYNSKRNYIVLSYTGLNDKKDVEIYEGDIVLVTYGDSKMQKVIKWDSVGFLSLDNGNEKEIIGNIYENPELLEQHD